ncbi:MAG TPA: ABC transporter permease [Clostridiales bacterium]|jgi:simple sugar transport system permease protein|nr:ABC transporter permease [Clostridiales bacterium]
MNNISTSKLKKFLIKNIVVIVFVVISILAFIASKQSLYFLMSQLLERISRNSFLVLSLLIPVMAGMGLNFSIIIGAMAGQAALIIVTNYQIAFWNGFGGIILAMAIAAPMAIVFGVLTGMLLNKTKGQEMIASMIVGFFANGIYQFIFLFAVGGLFTVRNKDLLLTSGVGLRNSITFTESLKFGLDFGGVTKVPFFNILMVISGIMILVYLIMFMLKKTLTGKQKSGIAMSAIVLVFSALIMYTNIFPLQIRMLKSLTFPAVSGLFIALLCGFNMIIIKTKLGQDFRAVGQNQHIAAVSGINVNRVRIIAITISTVLAAWGQIIFLQEIGVMNTFGSHVQIAQFSVAALLVGGATVSRATNNNAIVGVILFHTLFIVSPFAGKELFGDPQIGEFFRTFVAYGVIGLSLGLYAWKTLFTSKK